LLAIDRAGYGRLARLITLGRRRAEKGECRIEFRDVAEHSEGLIACVPLHSLQTQDDGSCARGLAVHHGPERWLHRYREAFPDRCHALAELFRGARDERQLEIMIAQADHAGIPLAAANDVHYHDRTRGPLQGVLTAIRNGTTIDGATDRIFPNYERCLQPVERMMRVFQAVPRAIAQTLEVAQRCRFSLDELRYEYPEELVPAGKTPLEYLIEQTWIGARERWPDGIPDKVRQHIEHELGLIDELRYEAYFLTVWDLVRFARSKGILCQGRGSAANSVVCYCLVVTSVDPERIDLLFERFVSKERHEPPDIDIDFEHERREEVLQYIYEKYGRERAGMTAEVITYQPRSAIRDVGKALGLSEDRVDRLAKTLEGFRDDGQFETRCREAGLDPQSDVARRLVHCVSTLLDFPRHLSQHVGGMVIARGPLCELVPIENAAMEDRTVIQWNKDDLDAIGLLKVDCLGLGMLTAIRKSFDLIARHYQRNLTLATVPPEDARVYEMISRADTIGVFQIESRAQMSMLPRLRPVNFYDLVIEVAIVRPGPIQGGMVHPYLRRRAGEEAIDYPNDAIRGVLEKTLGVPLFQEQAMRLAVVAAGFTPGEADQLRKAMGAWRRTGEMERFQQKLIDGMTANGLNAEFAERVYRQICGFGEYGFPESHAASFALLAYVSAWLKCYYPAVFVCALLNSQPMGFYAPAQLVRDAREHGVTVLPFDVAFSDWDHTLEELQSDGTREERDVALRLGMRLISGMSQEHAERIAEARRSGPFRGIGEFARRTRLPRPVLARLAKADAFQSLSVDRRQALWDSLGSGQEPPLFAGLIEDRSEQGVALPALNPFEQVIADYCTAGLSLKGHPLSFARAELDRIRVVPASRLATCANGKPLRVAGIVLSRQRPGTSKGITFVTLEDETGIINLIVQRAVWDRCRKAARGATALLAAGRLERRNEVIHVIVTHLDDLSRVLAGHRIRARDFH
jgi:error-prone DNA polymerase